MQYPLSQSTAVQWCWFVPTCGKAVWGAKIQYLLSLSIAVQWCWFVPACGKALWGAKIQYLLLLSTAVQWYWFVPTCGKAVPPLSVNSCTEMLIFDLFLLVTRQCEVLKCRTSSLCQQLYRQFHFSTDPCIPHVRTKTFGPRCFSDCALKAVEFTPFRQPSHSHSILSHLQNYVKNSPPQTISQVNSNSSLTPHCIHLCVCVCVCVCVWGIQYYDYIIDYFWSFNVYVIVGLVKCAACSPLLVRYGTVEMVAIISHHIDNDLFLLAVSQCGLPQWQWIVLTPLLLLSTTANNLVHPAVQEVCIVFLFLFSCQHFFCVQWICLPMKALRVAAVRMWVGTRMRPWHRSL